MKAFCIQDSLMVKWEILKDRENGQQAINKSDSKEVFATLTNNKNRQEPNVVNPKTGEIRRFLTGFIACELTGIAFSEDYATMFCRYTTPKRRFKRQYFSLWKNAKIECNDDKKTLDGGVIGS